MHANRCVSESHAAFTEIATRVYPFYNSSFPTINSLVSLPCSYASPFSHADWNTLPNWQNQYQTAMLALRNQARRTRQDDMAVAASPAGGPDTITQGSP